MSLLNDIFSLRRMNDLRADGLWPTIVTIPISPYWTTLIGTATGAEARDIKTDSSGNVYVLSTYTSGGYGAIYLAKFDSAGTLLWQKGYGETGKLTDPLGLDVDSSGNAYICGALERNSATNNKELFLLKVNSAGTIQWQKSNNFSGRFNEGTSVVVSGSNVTVFGYSRLPAYTLTLQQWDTTTGTMQWKKMYSGAASSFTYSKSISADSSGNLYVCGASDTSGSPGSGVTDIILMKFNSGGVIQWQKRLVGATGFGWTVALDASSNVYINGLNNQSGNNDALIAKYNSSGTLQWQKRLYSASYSEFGRDISLDSSGNLYATVQFGVNNTLFKCDSSGALQWQKKLATNNPYGDDTPRISIFGSFVYQSCTPYTPTGSSRNVLVTKVPTDGSINGTYNITSVASLTLTYETSTLLSISDTSLTDTTVSFTEANSSLTETTPSITALTPSFTPTLISIS
jgi:hypothetical protein